MSAKATLFFLQGHRCYHLHTRNVINIKFLSVLLSYSYNQLKERSTGSEAEDLPQRKGKARRGW